MTKKIIVTNNPLLKDKFNSEILEYCQNLEEVYKRTRNLIHQGYILITHPLAGSLKPYQNPYRSIAVQKGEELDYFSLRQIEGALQKMKQFAPEEKNFDNYSDEVKEDYQLIDYSLLESGKIK